MDILNLIFPAKMNRGAIFSRNLQILSALIFPFHQNESNTVNDQRNGNHDAVVQMCIHPVVQQHTHHTGGNNGGNDLEPQNPGLLPFFLGLGSEREGIQLMEKQHDDR